MPENTQDNTNKKVENGERNEQADGMPDAVRREASSLRKAKSIWRDIKNSKFYKKFRASTLNPYHFGVPEIKTDSLESAREIIRNKAKVAKQAGKNFRAEFIYNGTRYFGDRPDCSLQQEYKKDGMVIRDGYEVSERIPRNQKGEPDLFAETPVVIAINPIEGPALVGHVCMQYKDQVVNRLLPSIHTDPLYPKYEKYAEYYFVYPSQLGINPKELYREMEKHNIKKGDKRYSLLFNNCAQNVANVLKKVGVKDFDFYGPDFLGISYATPGNNPFGAGIKSWCRKHGLRAHLDEMAEYDRKYAFSNVRERRDEMKSIRRRYRKITGQESR